MMRLFVLLTLTLSACYSPTIGDGQIGCATGSHECPTGYYCAMAVDMCFLNGHVPSGDGGAAPQLLLANAVLDVVSADESFMAYRTQSVLTGDQQVGDLNVVNIADPAKPIFTDAQAFAVSSPTLGGDVVYYNVNPAISTDSGAPVYGQLKTWNTRMTQPVALSTGFASVYTLASDGSFVIWFDTSTPSSAAMGDVSLARTADCKNTSCNIVALATGVSLYSDFSITADHRFAAYTTTTGSGAMTTYAVQLADIEKGTQTTLISGAVAPGISFSPDGSLLAIGLNGTKALSVFKTADGSTVTWGGLPAGVIRVLQTAFTDSTTLYLRASDGTTSALYKAPATATATPLSPSGAKVAAFQLPHTSQTEGTSRYLFASTSVMNGVGDLQVYDLQASPPQPTQIAAAASLASLVVSNSQGTVRFLENYAYTTSRGTLTLQDLPPAGAAHTLAPNIFLPNVSNIPIDEVAFIDTFTDNGTLQIYKDGNTLPIANGVLNERIRMTPSPQIYFSVTTPDTRLGLQPGIYSMPLP